MSNNQDSNTPRFDLEDRTARFGANVIKLCKKIPNNSINSPLINQIVKASTSVGANYCEADDAESKKDFRHKIGICKKEARESKHFLKMFLVSTPEFSDEITTLLQEALELNLIFNKIYQKVK